MPFAMVLNSCAVLGFLLLIRADFAQIQKLRARAQWLRALGYATVALALVLLALAPHAEWPLSVPRQAPALVAPGPEIAVLLFFFAACSAALLLWSVFFELNISRKTQGLRAEEVIKTGSYAICRHPGFWWFFFFVFSVALGRGPGHYIFSAILLVGMDLLLIVVQDQYVFPKLIEGYEEYKKSVPFLLPVRRNRSEK